tara:strand:+ start:93 stop:341 length:249 start_codon:yes stop_codon:yes gene_type:complete
MKTITVTFTVNQEDLLEALKRVAEQMDLKLVDNIDFDSLSLEFNQDVENFIKQDLSQFIEDGWDNDLYSDYFEESDEEDDED